jgi:cation transport ATPase
MSVQTETFEMTGIRCERCIGRLAGALRGHDGLEFANANLMGEVILSWDEDKTSREALLAEMARVGFHPLVTAASKPAY